MSLSMPDKVFSSQVCTFLTEDDDMMNEISLQSLKILCKSCFYREKFINPI